MRDASRADTANAARGARRSLVAAWIPLHAGWVSSDCRAETSASSAKHRRATAGASPFARLAARRLVVSVAARSRGRRAGGAVAMANPRRSQRVSQQILREVSTMMLNDKRVRLTMSPEERLGADSSVSTVASVTDVVLSGDLQVAKIYVSFFGEPRGAELAFAGLVKLEGYVRSQVGKAMQLRSVPALRFVRDDGAERGNRVMALLSGLSAENGGAAGGEEDEEDETETTDSTDGPLLYETEESDDVIEV